MTGLVALSSAARRDAELDLVHRCRLGSEAASAELIEASSRPLFALAVRLVGSPSVAEAIVRDAYVEGFRLIERHAEHLPLATWLAGLVVRRARRRVGSGPLGRPPVDAPADRGPGGDSDLAACLAALPFEQRAVLALRFGMGLGADETALALGVDRVEGRRRLTDVLDELRESEWGTPEAGARAPASATAGRFGSRRFAGREEA